MSSSDRVSENLERISRPAPLVTANRGLSLWDRSVLRWNNPPVSRWNGTSGFSDTTEDSYSSSSSDLSYISTSSEPSEEEILETSRHPIIQWIDDPFEQTTSEEDSLSGSTSDSSTLADDDPFPVQVIISTPRQSRRPVYFYPIRGSEGRDFVFGFSSRINTLQADAYFLDVPSFSSQNLNNRISSVFRARRSRNVKVGIIRGKYKNQPGVITKSYTRRSCVHKVLLGDGSSIFIHQRHVLLLDPYFFLPFGFPTYLH